MEDDGPVLVEALSRPAKTVHSAGTRGAQRALSGQGRPRRWLPGHFTKHQPIHCVKSAGCSLGRRPPLTVGGKDLRITPAETLCGGVDAPEAIAASSRWASAHVSAVHPWTE